MGSIRSQYFFSKTLPILVFFANFSSIQMQPSDKRQIGVLARTGTLPQGKRATAILNREELKNEYQTLNFIIRGLHTAEKEVVLKMEALVEKLIDSGKFDEDFAFSKSKKTGETIVNRSGHLMKPFQKISSRQTNDPFDEENFHGGKSFNLEHPRLEDENWRNKFDADDVGDQHDENVYNGETNVLRNELLEIKSRGTQRRIGSGSRDDDDYDDDDDDDAGIEAKEYKDRKHVKESLRILPEPVGTFSLKSKNGKTTIDKRFLGRIPQLGRIHQKVQSPSGRRRPHLRPNWL